MILWPTEKNLENREKEIKEEKEFPTLYRDAWVSSLNLCTTLLPSSLILMNRTLHRLRHLDDDKESSLIEQKKVLICRKNTEGITYQSLEDLTKSTPEQSDMAVNDDEDKSDVDKSLDDPSKGRPEQSDAVLKGHIWTVYMKVV